MHDGRRAVGRRAHPPTARFQPASRQYGMKGTLITVVCVALLITGVDQLANAFKHGFMRPRPCRVAAFEATIRYIAERCGRYGYYSAHAGNSMAVAVFAGLALRRNYKNLIFFLLFISEKKTEDESPAANNKDSDSMIIADFESSEEESKENNLLVTILF